MISTSTIEEALPVYLSRPSTSWKPERPDPRVQKVNAYLALAAAKVFNDEVAVELLAELHQRKVVSADELGMGPSSRVSLALAKLAAAAFCDVGTNVVSITSGGEDFVQVMLEGSLEQG